MSTPVDGTAGILEPKGGHGWRGSSDEAARQAGAPAADQWRASILFDAQNVIVHGARSGVLLFCLGRTAERAIRPGLRIGPLHWLFSLGRRGREEG